jgi:hypothetical protein
MRIISGIFLLFLLMATAHSQNEIDASISILASSEPVPLNDMVNGWDGDYKKGELAFTDATWQMGFTTSIDYKENSLGKVRVARGYRIYYYLKFHEDTADYYRAQEQKTELNGNKILDLEVKHFEAPSISFSYTSPTLDLPLYKVKSGFNVATNLYRPGHMQFAKVKGVAFGPGTSAFSADIDYRYDQFKLPWLEDEKGYETTKGEGYSFDLGVFIDQEDWYFGFDAKDVLTQLYWESAGVTVACLQTESGEGAVCEDNGGNGRSDLKSVVETIPVSFSGVLKHKGYDLSLHAFQHDTFKRLGIEKGFKTELGRFALFLYHPRLFGASWQTDYFNLQIGADTLEFSTARNIQLNMGVNWHW